LETAILRTKEEKGAGYTFVAGLKASKPMWFCFKLIVTQLPPEVLPPLMHWQELSPGVG